MPAENDLLRPIPWLGDMLEDRLDSVSTASTTNKHVELTSQCSVIPHPISDSIWLKRGSLLVGAGHIMLLYGHKKPEKGAAVEPGLFETVARYNGPLDDYHPQMILQCLLWGT